MATVPLCACGAPCPGAVLCQACAARLGRDLALAADLSPDLDAAVARLTVRGGGARRTSDVQPLPYDPDASAVAGQLRGVLCGWVRVIRDMPYRRDDPWPADTVPAMARWLGARIDAVRQHDAAQDIADEVRDAVRAVQRVLVWDGIARSAVRQPDEGLVAAVEKSTVLGSPAQIADWLTAVNVSVAESTISSWGTRGRIERHPPGLYRLSEVYGMAMRRRA